MIGADVAGAARLTRPRRDAVAQRVTSNGRLVSFISTDLIPGRPLRLWGAVVETGDSARGGAKSIGGREPSSASAFIRIGILGANDGWSVTQLLAAAQARFAAELARTGEAEVEAIVRCLDRATAVHREALDDEPAFPVGFEPGSAPSGYPWTVARAGLFTMALCPDAENQGDGIGAEQLLAVLDLALSAWLPVTPWRYRAWATRRAVREALAIESSRAAGAGA